MAHTSFQEIAQTYAKEVRDAVRGDGFTKIATVTKSLVIGSKTLKALKLVYEGIESGWEIEGKPLTDEQKAHLAELVGIELGMPKPGDFYGISKSASNDAYMQMINHIGDLIKVVAK